MGMVKEGVSVTGPADLKEEKGPAGPEGRGQPARDSFLFLVYCGIITVIQGSFIHRITGHLKST